jgi:AraC-like DNA-binding protein
MPRLIYFCKLSGMKFEMHLPCDSLKPFIRYLAISENPDESSYKVLPDTGVVIGFQYKGKLSVLNSDQAIPLASSGLTGLNDSFRIFKNSADIGTVLVFFKEAGAAAFFSQPIHELFRESVSLDNFMLQSELLILEERLSEATTDLNRIAVVEQFLISKMAPVQPDKLVLTALSIIHKHKGNIRISDLASQLNISQSPLEKRFRKAVGASPKKFASILRFKYILQEKQGLTTETLTNLAYRAGFYDQAHFIKEFRNFTGEAPEAFFATSKS